LRKQKRHTRFLEKRKRWAIRREALKKKKE